MIAPLNETPSVTERIVELIATGQLQRSERLREVEISERLGVSRIPLREAMKQLASQGVLEARTRGGMNVKSFDIKQIQEVQSVRGALEPIAMRAAASKLGSMENRIALNAIIEELRWAVDNQDRKAIAAADIAFHSFLMKLSDNDLIQSIWSGLKFQLHIIFYLELCVPMELAVVVDQHLVLRDKLLDRDLDDLEEIVAAHVQPELNTKKLI